MIKTTIFDHVGKRCIAGLNPGRCIIVSVINAEGPPVPIPNTEVKLCSADNTRLATARKDRSTLTRMLLAKYCREHSFYSSLAQSVERMTVNHDVAGSSPAGGAIYVVFSYYIDGSPCWARTSDIMINSHALYRLS